MNINDLTNGLDQQKLNSALKKLSGVMNKQDMNNVMNALKSNNKDELNRQMSQINPNDINKVIANNPALKNVLNSNQDAMKSLNSFLSQNKGK